MKIDQKIVLIYLILGIILGYFSYYFSINSNLLIALIFPFVIFCIALFPLFKLVREKKKKWLIWNSFITFVLVWILVWLTLFNM